MAICYRHLHGRSMKGRVLCQLVRIPWILLPGTTMAMDPSGSTSNISPFWLLPSLLTATACTQLVDYTRRVEAQKGGKRNANLPPYQHVQVERNLALGSRGRVTNIVRATSSRRRTKVVEARARHRSARICCAQCYRVVSRARKHVLPSFC